MANRDDNVDVRETIFIIVRSLHTAADNLAALSQVASFPDETANNYVDWCNWLRAFADDFAPPEENWGGENVIRFPHERVAGR